jgi:hypothetical protein
MVTTAQAHRGRDTLAVLGEWLPTTTVALGAACRGFNRWQSPRRPGAGLECGRRLRPPFGCGRSGTSCTSTLNARFQQW